MKDSNIQVNISSLPGDCARIFIKDPLFMFMCPIKSKRAEFIEKYFNYYLDKWNTSGELISTGSNNVVAVLRDPDKFLYKFPGKHGLSLRMNKYSYNILNHMEVVQNIINIVVPEQFSKRLLTIFTSPDVSDKEIEEIIKVCKKKAEEENFVLVYETFSKRFISEFEKEGFETGYSRQFLNTQFFETVMTYNI